MANEPFIARVRMQATSYVITLPPKYAKEHNIRPDNHYWFVMVKEVNKSEAKQRAADIQRD